MSPAMSHREVGCSADGKVYSMAWRMAHSMVRLEKDSLDSVLVGILWTIYIQIKRNSASASRARAPRTSYKPVCILYDFIKKICFSRFFLSLCYKTLLRTNFKILSSWVTCMFRFLASVENLHHKRLYILIGLVVSFFTAPRDIHIDQSI